jgi:acyl-coenzyme A synthetase/AMP-(fatty) acid ligase
MSWLPIAALLATGRPADQPVALRGGEVLRWRHFATAVASAAARLDGGPWRRAVLLTEDSWLFAVGLLGALHAGLTVVLPPHKVAAQAITAADPEAGALDEPWLAQAAAGPAGATFALLDAARCPVEFFTSGSTGVAKRVPRSLAGLQAEVDVFQLMWGGTSGRGLVCATVSHQHLYGLTFKLLWSLSAGRPFATGTDETWEAVLPLLDGETMLVSSPAHLTRMAGLPALPPGRRPRRVFSAGAPLPPAANLEATALLGVVPTEIFGSTETGAIATRSDADVATPWRLLPGIAMRIGEGGRLLVRSPAIDGTLDGEGWYRTEDLVAPAAGGFHFLGRADRMAKIEGKRVDLPALERALEGSGWAEAAAVLVVPGNPPHLAAVVVPNAAARQQLVGIGAFRFSRLLRRQLADVHGPAGLPRQWRFVDALPAARMGKRSEADLRALFADAP